MSREWVNGRAECCEMPDYDDFDSERYVATHFETFRCVNCGALWQVEWNITGGERVE